MPSTAPAVTVVVHADGPWDETLRCLRALDEAAEGVPHERLVLDDGTADGTRRGLERLRDVAVARTAERVGFARAANAARRLVRAPLVAFLHADAVPNPGWLAPLLRAAEADPGVAAVASRLVDPTGLVEADGILFAYAAPYPITPIPHGAGVPALPAFDAISAPAASAAALLVRAARLDEVGGLDEAFGPAAAGLDLCLRLRAAGGEVLVHRESAAVHAGRCPGDLSTADAARFTRRWLGKLPLLDAGEARRRPAPAPRPGRPAIAVVVPVHNALATIAPCLEALARELGPEDELIVAEAGSDDGSGEYAALFARERGGPTRLVAAEGLEAALLGGLDAVGRRLTLVYHPVVTPPGGLLDDLSSAVEGDGAPSSVAVEAEPGVAAVLGPTALLRELGRATPALLTGDPAPLAAAMAARGARLAIVGRGAA